MSNAAAASPAESGSFGAPFLQHTSTLLWIRFWGCWKPTLEGKLPCPVPRPPCTVHSAQGAGRLRRVPGAGGKAVASCHPQHHISTHPGKAGRAPKLPPSPSNPDTSSWPSARGSGTSPQLRAQKCQESTNLQGLWQAEQGWLKMINHFLTPARYRLGACHTRSD